MRMLIALLFFLSTGGQAAAFNPTVDLNSPGVLESLRAERPEHYAKARAILTIAETRPTPDVGRWLEARFEASDVELLQWQVSDPPRLRVSFTLDATRYTGVVVPSLAPVRPMPAR
jgi:hypothetical protein